MSVSGVSVKGLVRRQVNQACDGLERLVLAIPEEDLFYPLTGRRSAFWHFMHCSTWISIVGECYEQKMETYVYASSLPKVEKLSNLPLIQHLNLSKNRALQKLGEMSEETMQSEMVPPFSVLKSGNPAPISRLRLWSWLGPFLEFQRGFLIGQLQIDPHNRRIEEFL